MNALVSQSITQLVIWVIGLVQLILALYILILNTRHPANRHSSVLFMLFAINNFATGWIVGAQNASEAYFPAALLSAVAPVFGIALLVTAIVLVKPKWLYSRWRWAWSILYVLAAIPVILVIIDLLTGSQIWFIGPDPVSYQGGYSSITEFISQDRDLVRQFYIMAVPMISLVPLFYLALFDKELTASEKRMARLLLAGQLGAFVSQTFVRSFLPQPYPSVLASTIFFLVYAHASFTQLISERRLQRGRLQGRLTALVLVISIPLLIFTSAYLFNQTSAQIRLDAVGRLDQASNAVGSNVETWLDLNIKALRQMVNTPNIISMSAQLQKPVLESFDEAYPHMYLVSTTDLSGMNVARSDDNDLTDYSDRQWYRSAVQGQEIVFQTLIGRTSGEPALVISTPIFGDRGAIRGVGMFASDLDDISAEIADIKIGETGRAFIVDSENKVVAHTNPELANQQLDLTRHPAVAAMRKLDLDHIQYRDQNGMIWIAYFQEIEYNWGVVVEQEESELMATLRSQQFGTWIIILLGSLLLGVLTALAIRQSIQPINSLTDTATAIASGDLSRVAPVESYDEIGILAQTFNRMTEQLLELIGNLEKRVAERTQDLEKRSNQLEATAQVGRAASSILDIDELIGSTVELIRERFELYYVGIFLVGENREFAVLRAGTGEVGKAMLARQHMIRIGAGMIGWCVANGQPRIAMDVGTDAQRLATSELPETRSEAALPLRSRGQVIGAVTLQSKQPDFFDESTIAVFQTMSDLVSVAIDNAQLYTETESALRSTQRVYSELTHDDWLKTLQTRPQLSFRSDQRGVTSEINEWSPEMKQAWMGKETVITQQGKNGEAPKKLAIPIKVRGNVIGVLETHKSQQIGSWTKEEKEILETIIEQLGVALDSARLYEETQIQANNERLIGEITSQMRETLDIETVLQTAARELRTALDLEEVEIRMGSAPDQNGNQSTAPSDQDISNG